MSYNTDMMRNENHTRKGETMITLETHNRWVEQNARLAEGMAVRVYWGYGLGFRVDGPGVITKVYGKSVRVRLTEDVACYGSKAWSAGTELKGIPRVGNDEWRAYENGVEIESN